MTTRLIAAFVLLLATASAAVAQTDPVVNYRMLTQAESVIGTPGEKSPPKSDAWQSVALPDNWNASHPGFGGYVWYRLPLQDIEGGGKLAVLLPRLCMNAELWVNNSLIGDGGKMTDPVARNWHRPLYFIFSRALLKADANWLYIRVYAYPNDGGGLGHPYFGKDTDLKPLFERVNFVDNTLSIAALVLTVAVTLMLLTLWLLRKGQSLYGWMSASGIFWSIVIVNQLFEYPPLWLTRYSWEWLVHSSIDLYSFSLLMVVHRFVDAPRKKIEAATATYFLTASALAWLLAGDQLVVWFNAIHIGAIVAGCYMIVFCAWQYWKTRQARALGMTIAIVCCLIIAMHDWLAIVTSKQLGTMLIMQFGPPIVLVLLGVWMMLQFSKVLDSEERRRLQIEKQIAEVSEELNIEHAKRMELERKTIVLAERQQFSRELHDGMGGHLMSLRNMLSGEVHKDSNILSALDQAIIDMRLLVDAVGEDNNDIGMIIGMVRSRVEPQIAHTSLRVEWQLTGLPMDCLLHKGYGLHLARILQESITNVMRHAQAGRLVIKASHNADSAAVMIEITDNGCGIPENVRFGRGIANIRERSRLIGGHVEFNSLPGQGTTILLNIPVIS
ncbi:MAG: ATP-binding protein [Sideroxydans sp.]|nr:ATP-binding protein [Sideroxydans sp.]